MVGEHLHYTSYSDVLNDIIQPTFNIGDPILHIELRRWADIVLVAPCSANTLSKIAHGLCDNLAVRKLYDDEYNPLTGV